MGAPHNPKRYGEIWDPEHLAVLGQEIEAIKDYVVVSGGWAWHYMTPPHAELKHGTITKTRTCLSPRKPSRN